MVTLSLSSIYFVSICIYIKHKYTVNLELESNLVSFGSFYFFQQVHGSTSLLHLFMCLYVCIHAFDVYSISLCIPKLVPNPCQPRHELPAISIVAMVVAMVFLFYVLIYFYLTLSFITHSGGQAHAMERIEF